MGTRYGEDLVCDVEIKKNQGWPDECGSELIPMAESHKGWQKFQGQAKGRNLEEHTSSHIGNLDEEFRPDRSIRIAQIY